MQTDSNSAQTHNYNRFMPIQWYKGSQINGNYR